MPQRPAQIFTTPTILAIALLIGAGASPGPLNSAFAQTPQYYRCGPQGQDLRDTPCPPEKAGSALPLPRDQVTPDQTRAAQDRAARESRATDALRRDRERFEARPGPGATGIRDGVGERARAASAPRTVVAPKPPKPPKAPKPRKPKASAPASDPALPPAPKLPKAPKASAAGKD